MKHQIQCSGKSLEVEVLPYETGEEEFRKVMNSFVEKHNFHNIVRHHKFEDSEKVQYVPAQPYQRFEGELEEVGDGLDIFNNWEVLECTECGETLDITNGGFYVNGEKLS